MTSPLGWHIASLLLVVSITAAVHFIFGILQAKRGGRRGPRGRQFGWERGLSVIVADRDRQCPCLLEYNEVGGSFDADRSGRRAAGDRARVCERLSFIFPLRLVALASAVDGR